ncbi:hypothetical protein MUP59_07150 [Candidatus Bathyarchaeota archaeon]|nr:hypothetical protein [Candidatus Bathyarchaeota archaeon]
MPRKSSTTIDDQVVVKIETIPYNRAWIRITGTKPLLSDRCPYMGEGYKAGKPTEQEKYKASLYIFSSNGKNTYGFPVKAIKSACINAARFIPGLAMTQVRGLFFVEAERDLLEIESDKTPIVDCQMVHKKDGKSIPTVRARFDVWSMKFEIKWQPTMTNIQTIIRILEVAGENIGIGPRRPEKSGTQEFGTFTVRSIK